MKRRMKKIKRVKRVKKEKKTKKGENKMVKRGKGSISFVSVVKENLDKGVTDAEVIIKAAKVALPGLDEKKLRARVNATIKYLGKKPVKKEKVVKPPKVEKPAKEVKKEITPVVPVTEEKKVPVVAPTGPADTTQSVTGPQVAQEKLKAATEEKKDDGVGDIVIQ